MKKKSLVFLLGVFLVAVGAVLILRLGSDHKQISKINSFEECAAKYGAMESYPEKCVTPDGRSFTQDIGNELSMQDLIKISVPRPNEKITSPKEITGEARGSWFFEAGFPIELQDGNGKVIAKAQAQANRDWMTTEFVPYTAEIVFKKPATAKGKLILRSDNPSGLPKNDKSLIVPVEF